MLRSQTLFVLGAGAGFDLGMPIGETLSNEVAARLNIQHEQGTGTLKSGDSAIAVALKRITAPRREDYNQWRATGCTISQGIHYSGSIDSYINTHKDNEKVRICAKLGIVRTILEYEKASALFVANTHPRRFREQNIVTNSWLGKFLRILQDRIIASENLNDLFTNLCVINFNYDRCIEQFLVHALQDLYQRPDETTKLINDGLKIFHPYGVVGSLPWQNAKSVVPFGGNEDGNDYAALIDGIKTFNEQIEEGDELQAMREEVARAERILFLGFHFHDQNMELLRAAEAKENNPVRVFGTALNRSNSDVEIIKSQIHAMLGQRGGITSTAVSQINCGQLFGEFGATLMR
jgi:hypothetical protein